MSQDDIMFQDNLIGLAEGERMVVADLLSHDGDILSQVLGYEVEAGVLENLRERFQAQIEEDSNEVVLRLVVGVAVDTSKLPEGDVETFCKDLRWAGNWSLFQSLVAEGTIYDFDIDDAQVVDV